jgi:RND family efflux transporter MFP subunit
MANAGEKVNVDSPLFSLVDLGRMEIEAPAPAFEVPSIRTGQAASFRVDGFGERVFDGRVERINPVADAGSRAITLYISVANRDGALKGGMFAKGQIVLGEARAAPVVPASAIREESGQSFVYTLENGKIGRRAVQVGFTEPQLGLVEIQSGLEQGLNVVSARVAGLKAGAPAVLKPAVASAPQRKG